MAEESNEVQVRFTCSSPSGRSGCGWQGIVTGERKPGNWVSCRCPECGYQLAENMTPPPEDPAEWWKRETGSDSYP